MATKHVPVLLEAVLNSFEGLNIKFFLDATVGAGGHAAQILAAHPEIEKYIALDQDKVALCLAKENLAEWSDKVLFINSNFSRFDTVLQELKLEKVDGMLADVGVSSMQLDEADRGFSFMRDGPLDMRMNRDSDFSAFDIVNFWSEVEISRILRIYGEEPQHRKISRAIVQARAEKAIETTLELKAIIEKVIKPNYKKKICVATLTFQALRIATNKELECLSYFVTNCHKYLTKNGVVSVISFHSLEDRIIKREFRYLADDKLSSSGVGGIFLDKEPVLKNVSRPIGPTEAEVELNSRSRTAKLRSATKI